MVYRDEHLARTAALADLARRVRALAAEARASPAKRAVPRALEKLAAGIERDAIRERARDDGRPPGWLSVVVGAGLAVLIVLAGCGVFLVCVLPVCACTSHVEQARTDSLAVRSAAELYLAQDPGAPCPRMKDLTRERILSSSTRTEDPWGMPFQIRCDGDDITIISGGPDRRLGTEDDVR